MVAARRHAPTAAVDVFGHYGQNLLTLRIDDLVVRLVGEELCDAADFVIVRLVGRDDVVIVHDAIDEPLVDEVPRPLYYPTHSCFLS